VAPWHHLYERNLCIHIYLPHAGLGIYAKGLNAVVLIQQLGRQVPLMNRIKDLAWSDTVTHVENL
jgi:hypothetical protein